MAVQDRRMLQHAIEGLVKNQNEYCLVPAKLSPDLLVLKKLSDATEIRRFRKESIGGTLKWNKKFTDKLEDQCGSEAVSWCVQVSGVDHEPIRYRSGPNTCVHLTDMLDAASLRYYTRQGLQLDQANIHLQSENPILVLLTSDYRDNFAAATKNMNEDEIVFDHGKYHWIVVSGIDSKSIESGRETAAYSYWVVSNGCIRCKVSGDVLMYLVNNAIGKRWMGGCYTGPRVIYVNI